MNAEIISVGTELLLGEIANTDAQFISERLAEIGINVFYHTVVGDNKTRLKAILEIARSRSDVIITTGGLGPTYDDMTKEIIAEVFEKKLVFDQKSVDRLVDFMNNRSNTNGGFTSDDISENNKKQACLPEGCTVLQNDWGTAPACAFESGGKHVIMLPGPPRECNPLTVQRVIPYLKNLSDEIIHSRVLRLSGIGESKVENMLGDLMKTAVNPTIAPYVKTGGVMIRIAAKAKTLEQANALIDPVAKQICDILGDYVYGIDVASLEEVIVNLLKEKKVTLAAAESCTGGMLSKKITDISGCSEVYLGGVCSYANSVKNSLLNVRNDILEKYGAVSRETAIEMAHGICKKTLADIGVSITGIAGPGGGSDEKPVGLVYIGLCYKGVTKVEEYKFGGIGSDRDRIRNQAVNAALNMVRNILLL